MRDRSGRIAANPAGGGRFPIPDGRLACARALGKIYSPIMNDIRMLKDERVGFGFVPPEYLAPGKDEYHLRNEQLRAMGKDPASYRRLTTHELETLVRNDNSCTDWSQFLVSDPFTPELIRNSSFAGLIRIGALQRLSLEHHDLTVFTGIADSQIFACDIGDNCVIDDCAYLAHYIIGDNCILLDNDEIHVSNHAKFGSGLVMDGESEDVRITLDIMNEAGGRAILPFDGMTCADAYLWARHRGNPALMNAFKAMTERMFDLRRGRYGVIGPGCVIKSTNVIKDVAIGASAYIKGANKLKNLTINSSEEARTQIGEGVELVNGIIGYGCRIFYGSKAVRFAMGENSSLKYGARLIHSVLGENSTVSCCEILNNLIFPSHEQHHNTSFLIASLVRGQSNMAAGATIGSNHNSRAPDGEIEAGRGFWPGLSTSVKHSSRFASFCLLAKGDFRFELDIPLPFCLVDDDRTRDRLVLVPAYWWTHNLYALMRNESKFKSRDKRRDTSLQFEYSPFAPDTAEEIRGAMGLLETWAAASWNTDRAGARARLAAGRDGESDAPVLARDVEHSDRPAVVRKPARAWCAYRDMLLWYAMISLLRYAAATDAPAPAPAAAGPRSSGYDAFVAEFGAAAPESPTHAPRWENLGGLLVASERLDPLLARAAAGELATWHDMHAAYAALSAAYPGDKARDAWACLRELYADGAGAAGAARAGSAESATVAGASATVAGTSATSAASTLTRDGFARAMRDFIDLTQHVEREVYNSRAKDWENRFRRATFRSDEEFHAVMGKPEDASFVKSTRKEMAALRAQAQAMFGGVADGGGSAGAGPVAGASA